ncbi:unnamed protein product [Polarella glacialis]|uniref:Uncharacterized protein n=1 Tax=Polarella glacialis TaxID=89957 RepID=A0A813J3M7_POLGL|nr:unnamed protein product [Polarella glacialis]
MDAIQGEEVACVVRSPSLIPAAMLPACCGYLADSLSSGNLKSRTDLPSVLNEFRVAAEICSLRFEEISCSFCFESAKNGCLSKILSPLVRAPQIQISSSHFNLKPR